MILLLLGFLLGFQIYGPGALAYTTVLEQVSETRIKYGYGLDSIDGYEVLVAPSDCDLLGKNGWLITEDEVLTAIVVDCESEEHKGIMKERNILADVNKENLGKGWLIIK